MKPTQPIVLVLIVLVGLGLTACGGGAPAGTPTPEGPQGDPVAGKTAFGTTCVSCHGPDAKGMTGLGKDLTTSEWIKTQSNTELVAFLSAGRPATDPLNTTGVDMPPKGGNPALTETDLINIVAYLRSINH